MPRNAKIPEVMIDVVIAEALGEGTDGMAQVGKVMFNRAITRGQSLQKVVTAPHQFTAYLHPGKEVRKAMKNEQLRSNIRSMLEKVQTGEIEVPFPYADHYHTPAVNPKWNKSPKLAKDGQLKNHIFYTSDKAAKSVRRYDQENPPANAPQVDVANAPTPPARPADKQDTIGELIEANSYVPQSAGTQATAPAAQAIEQMAPSEPVQAVAVPKRAIRKEEQAPTPPVPPENIPDQPPAPTASRSPFTQAGRDNLEQSRAATLNYDLSGAQRNLTPPQILERNIVQAVTDVYGPEYTVKVISGRQEKGVSRGVVGSRRHNTAAADVFVADPRGKVLRGDELLPLSQYWLAKDVGSVGFPAKQGQSIHMDMFGGSVEGSVPLAAGEGRVWYYGNPTAEQRAALTDSLANKTMPQLRSDIEVTPPAAGAAQQARLAASSNLNTPEESNQAAQAFGHEPIAILQNNSLQAVAIPDRALKTETPAPVRPAKALEQDDPAINTAPYSGRADYNRSPMLQEELDLAASQYQDDQAPTPYSASASYNRSPMLQEELDQAAAQFDAGKKITRPTKAAERDDPNVDATPYSDTASYNRSQMLQDELDQAAAQFEAGKKITRPTKSAERDDPNINTSPYSETVSYNRGAMLQDELERAADQYKDRGEKKTKTRPKSKQTGTVGQQVSSVPRSTPNVPKYIKIKTTPAQAQVDARDPNSDLAKQMRELGVAMPTSGLNPVKAPTPSPQVVEKSVLNPEWVKQNNQFSEEQRKQKGGKAVIKQPNTGLEQPKNFIQQRVGQVGDRLNQAGQRVNQIVTDPGGFLQDRATEMGDRVKTKFKPIADFLKGPQYERATLNEGWKDSGSNLVSVGRGGTSKVNIASSDRDRERDIKAHGDDMSGYRHNKAIFQKHGLKMNSENAKKLMEKGETFVVPKGSKSLR